MEINLWKSINCSVYFRLKEYTLNCQEQINETNKRHLVKNNETIDDINKQNDINTYNFNIINHKDNIIIKHVELLTTH